MKSLIILVSILTLTFKVGTSMTPVVAESKVKAAIDKNIDYDISSDKKCEIKSVEISVKVSSDNKLQITYINGNAELSDYVQSTIETMILENIELQGKSFSFTLNFN